MEQFEVLQDSVQYQEFLKDHADYAKIFGYDLSKPAMVKAAMFDGLLFEQFLEEVL